MKRTILRFPARNRGKVLQEGELPELKDMRLLQQMSMDLIRRGAGLPDVHQVSADDHHDEVVLNRQQQRELEALVGGIREYGRARGWSV